MESFGHPVGGFRYAQGADLAPVMPSVMRRICSCLPLTGAGCKLVWCEPVQTRVWSVGVVVDPPIFDDFAGLWQVAKEVFVEAFVTQADALHRVLACVLDEMARLHEHAA